MNEPLKYIIVGEEHLPLAIVFNPILTHKQIGRRLKVLSAGFCCLPDEHNQSASAWGESISLGIASRGDIDAEIITKTFKQE